jgi:hypothetical protein
MVFSLSAAGRRVFCASALGSVISVASAQALSTSEMTLNLRVEAFDVAYKNPAGADWYSIAASLGMAFAQGSSHSQLLFPSNKINLVVSTIDSLGRIFVNRAVSPLSLSIRISQLAEPGLRGRHGSLHVPAEVMPFLTLILDASMSIAGDLVVLPILSFATTSQTRFASKTPLLPVQMRPNESLLLTNLDVKKNIDSAPNPAVKRIYDIRRALKGSLETVVLVSLVSIDL